MSGGALGDFVHLHVASSFSRQYGATTPADLAARAAELGMSALALTDRDGLSGAIRFVTACKHHSIHPVLGVDLALDPTSLDRLATGGARSRSTSGSTSAAAERSRSVGSVGSVGPAPAGAGRSPARGGQLVDPRLPRITVLALGAGAGVPAGRGWARLCRLVTATHLAGERGRPVTTYELVAQHAVDAPDTSTEGGVWSAPTGRDGSANRRGQGVDPMHLVGRQLIPAARRGRPALVVLLGPDSDVGRAVLQRREADARALLERWSALLPVGSVVVELVCHDGPPGTPGSLQHARRMLQLATELGVTTVLSAAARHSRAEEAAVIDLLDAARRLVPLHDRHLDRTSTTGRLLDSGQMYALATRITGDAHHARALLRETVDLAARCVQDPRTDIGIGAVHLPEPTALGLAPGDDPQRVLAERVRAAVPGRYRDAGVAELDQVHARLEDELKVIATLGYPTYFLTVADVVDLIRDAGVRVAARGSGAGSLVNYLLGISGIEPIRHGLLMERFCTPLRAQLPDIDIDVESARRTEIYERILDRYGADRVTCVSMMETYRVRHAIRDVGAALGMPPEEVDAIAKAFPHIRAKDARSAIADLPELSSMGLATPRLRVFFELVEALDGMPRHIALHPCGVILSNRGLLDRTPVEASWLGFPMSQFDKDDVETLGLLKLDVLGIRMQSAMAHAVDEIARVEQVALDIDDRDQVPLDDEETFELVRSARTLGCFQIESPGQRELVGKFAPQTFDDLIIDISLFRPGPVKSDMVTPFLRARQGWAEPDLLHPTLAAALESTCGVVVFHEQVLHIISITAGVSLAEADEVRRALGSVTGQERVEAWWRPLARGRGYRPEEVDRIWAVLKAFASFGFCKAHAAAFAMPTYQSAWLKAHYPAHFLAGVLTHDPGMYPKRLILDDARNHGVGVLGLDINASTDTYRVEVTYDPAREEEHRAIRLALPEVKGISATEVQAIVAGQPYASMEDFWRRTGVSRPTLEKLVLAGGFDELYGLQAGGTHALGRHGRLTRRDLLLHVEELDRWGRSAIPSRRRRTRSALPVADLPGGPGQDDVRARAAAQSQAPLAAVPADQRATQLMLDLGDSPQLTPASGLPEMSLAERLSAELDILGLDVSTHVITSYDPMLTALGVVRSADIRGVRSRSEVLIAGVKVATQTPPVRSGRRVVFLTLDDSTGPVDATFFEDVQGPYAETVFHSWLLLVRGVVRRTGPRGVSVRATGAWELSEMWSTWELGGLPAVEQMLRGASVDPGAAPAQQAVTGEDAPGTGSDRRRRVLVHPSGFTQSPYADIRPAGVDARDGRAITAPRKMWHSSPGSSGR